MVRFCRSIIVRRPPRRGTIDFFSTRNNRASALAPRGSPRQIVPADVSDDNFSRKAHHREKNVVVFSTSTASKIELRASPAAK
jgi:hypothetical protein